MPVSEVHVIYQLRTEGLIKDPAGQFMLKQCPQGNYKIRWEKLSHYIHLGLIQHFLVYLRHTGIIHHVVRSPECNFLVEYGVTMNQHQPEEVEVTVVIRGQDMKKMKLMCQG